MTGALSTAREELPHVRGRGRSRKDPMPEGRRPRGVTPRPRSGQWPRVPDCDGAGTAERSYPASEVGGAAERRYPASEVRGIGREELPHAPMPEARGGRRGSNPTSKEPWLRRRRRA